MHYSITPKTSCYNQYKHYGENYNKKNISCIAMPRFDIAAKIQQPKFYYFLVNPYKHLNCYVGILND